MQSSVSSKSGQVTGSASIIMNLLLQVWNSVLIFLGATEETSEWWRAVFQRKLLRGAVGFRLRWSNNVQNDVLWELEGLVKELSSENLSQHKEKSVNVGQLLRNQSRYGYTQEDCNIYHLGHSSQGSNINTNKGGIWIDTRSNSQTDQWAGAYTSESETGQIYTNDNGMAFSDSDKSSFGSCVGHRGSSSDAETMYKMHAGQEQKGRKNHQSLGTTDLYYKDDREQTERSAYFGTNDIYMSSKWPTVTMPDHTFLLGAGNEIDKYGLDWNAHHASSDSSDTENTEETSDDWQDQMPASPVDINKDSKENILLSTRESSVNSLRAWTWSPFSKLASFIKNKRPNLPEEESAPHPLKRVTKVGLNIACTQYEDRKKHAIPDVKTSSSDDFGKFDVSVKNPESFNPLGALQRVVGLERYQLPPAPSDTLISQAQNTSDDSSPTRLYQLLQVPVNLLLFPVRLVMSALGEQNKLKHPETDNGKKLQSVRNPLYDDDLESLKMELTPDSTEHFLNGEEAYAYYNLLVKIEAKHKMKQLKKDRQRLIKIYKWKRKTLMEVVKIARDYYSDPTEANLDRWKALKKGLSKDHESNMDVRVRVATVPDYWPIFTLMIVMSQIVVLIALCIQFNIDKVGLKTTKSVRLGVPTFLGTETFTRLHEPNLWIGPPEHVFYAAGAVLAPCMRKDLRTEAEAVSKGYRPFDSTHHNYFGCCEMGSHFNRAGTTTLLECVDMTMGLGKWTSGLLCSRRPSARNSVAHVIKPCCTGYHGTCQMLSHEHCTFIKGIFHVECDHCVQVNCLADVCKVTKSDNAIKPDPTSPWMVGPDTRWQWWRLISAIPLTYGFIHLLLVFVVEVTMMVPLEVCIGGHRVMILYFCCCAAGELMAGVVEPDLPHVGSTGGVGGILGVAVLELFQAWSLIRKPLWEGIKLLLIIILFSLLGTFHLMSITSFLTGLVVGMMGCLMLVPYITFGHRLGHRRVCVVLLGFLLTIPTFITVHYLFQFVQGITLCPGCAVLECVPYTSVMCKTYSQRYK